MRLETISKFVLCLSLTISGMARAQDLDAEIDSFDRQLGGGNFDVRKLDLETIVGKNSDANSSGVPDKRAGRTSSSDISGHKTP